MSCIAVVGRRRFFGPECNVILPRSLPPWTKSKDARLKNFSVDKNPLVRQIAAAHPRTPHDRLVELVTDEDVNVRRAAIKNPAVTERMIRIALDDEDRGIAAYARMLQREDEDA